MSGLTRIPSIFGLVDEFENALQQNGGGAFTPPVDIHKNEKEYRVTAWVPGARKDQIDVHVEDGNLVISGKYEVKKPEGYQAVRLEIPAQTEFRRSLRIDQTSFNLDKIDAQLADGVLAITLPLSDSVQPRQIQVRVA